MGRIGRTYPRHDFGPPFVVPAGRLIFARRGAAPRFPARLAWLSRLVWLVLLAWPSM